jgi:hypothetical protein
MSIRTYKIVSLTLVTLVVLLAWKCFTLYGHIVNANFVAAQAAQLRATVRAANDGWTGSASVLDTLDWYIGYYDHRTNSLAGSGLLGLLWQDRERTVSEAITYLRKHGTNDFGDDPYKWLQKEHGR